MGLFDEIVCRELLPGSPPSFVKNDNHRFQSKSLDCLMSTYEITSDGKLRNEEGINEPGTFSLRFYSDNIRAACGGYYFTSNGEDWESVEYLAEFVDGQLRSISETEHDQGQALPIDKIFAADQDGEPGAEIDSSEPNIGDQMFLQWGGSREGYKVTLAVKTQRKWAVTTDSGDIETLHPSDFGRLLFHSREDAERCRLSDEARKRREFERYDALLQSAEEAKSETA